MCVLHTACSAIQHTPERVAVEAERLIAAGLTPVTSELECPNQRRAVRPWARCRARAGDYGNRYGIVKQSHLSLAYFSRGTQGLDFLQPISPEQEPTQAASRDD